MTKCSRLRLWQREQAETVLVNGGSKIGVARALGLSKPALSRELKRSADRPTRRQPGGTSVESVQAEHILMSMLARELEQDLLQSGSSLGADNTVRDIAIRQNPLILIVDDDRAIVRGLDLRLKSNGYDTATAFDGREGLDTALEARPDAIILDIRMPGMDGFTMMSRLRGYEHTSAIPTVVLSGKMESQARNKALDLGARYYLEKPCASGTLIQAVQSAMGAAQSGPAPLH